MEQSLYTALVAFSAALRGLAVHMQALSEEDQPPPVGRVRVELRVAVKTAEIVLATIEAHGPAAHWKTRRKLGSMAHEVRGLAHQLRGLDKELAAARARAPVGRSIAPSWLEIAGDRFTGAATHFGKLAGYYGRKAHGPRFTGEVIADRAMQEPVSSFERRRRVASEALFLQTPDVVVGEHPQMAALIPVYFAMSTATVSDGAGCSCGHVR